MIGRKNREWVNFDLYTCLCIIAQSHMRRLTLIYYCGECGRIIQSLGVETKLTDDELRAQAVKGVVCLSPECPSKGKKQDVTDPRILPG